ncbi:tetraacyldisaccharide 4'-kinase [Thalassotalea sp. PP2-459]|uniref:tetraacyldisaccharide 4'-kinase n=1 Tax=Thalassotalea sp. PP2-459 TaxID=1742724 RepID=UPI000943C4A2|nr:tetraacyldisaccharide 4'-kinase [Thalassotalea sp. PP2-459]OKY27917.1 tetraacyldisaccharide 4'-kinase [Thalassotalea sp. PP2-459]
MRLIEKVWFHQHPARYLLVPILLPISALFWLISSVRRLSFRYGLLTQTKPSLPVVVVGNIGVGGNGKTPVVLWLVECLKAHNINVGVISRGYGAKAPYYPYVVNEQSDATMVGDEPMMIFNRHQIPVVVDSDRNAAIEQLKTMSVELVISDDGLQHYKMARDLELIIVDGKRLFGNGLLLPAGPLRETTRRLKAVDHVIVNGNSTPLSCEDTPQHVMTLKAKHLINVATNEKVTLADFLLGSAQVNACAGIGSPERFFTLLSTLGFSVIKQKSFNDHHDFQRRDFGDFEQNMPLLMTEKDAVKCQLFADNNWWYLPVDAEFNELSAKTLIESLLTLVSNEREQKEE